MNPQALRNKLCKSFCSDLSIEPVPSGYSISAQFLDSSGDPVRCLLEKDGNGWSLFDDGQFLPDLIGRGIEVSNGSRREFLDRVLMDAGAFIDENILSIRTNVFLEDEVYTQAMNFLTGILRARDVVYWSRERIKNTFKEDAFQAVLENMKEKASVVKDASVHPDLADFPADIVVKPNSNDVLASTAIFLVQQAEQMNEALILWQALKDISDDNVRVAAIVEDGGKLISRKVQRASNRIDETVYFRGDERGAVNKIAHLAFRKAA